MKTCNNCLWRDVCDHASRCEYYEPIVGEENVAIREYEEILRERHEDYLELVKEQQSDEE